MKIGSETHKELFCRSFMDSYLEYDPDQLPWPYADNITLERQLQPKTGFPKLLISNPSEKL